MRIIYNKGYNLTENDDDGYTLRLYWTINDYHRDKNKRDRGGVGGQVKFDSKKDLHAFMEEIAEKVRGVMVKYHTDRYNVHAVECKTKEDEAELSKKVNEWNKMPTPERRSNERRSKKSDRRKNG